MPRACGGAPGRMIFFENGAMTFPLIDKNLLPGLRLAHGIFNAGMMLVFLYQGWTGYSIRRARMSGGPLPFLLIKRHRKTGPVAAVLGACGFLFGLVLVMLDRGRILEYPSHFAGGGVLVLLIAAVYGVSRGIQGPDSPLRSRHAGLGIALLLAYLIEVFLGIGVLF